MVINYITDKGKARELNEDFVLASKLEEGFLLVVADGMGGHNAGEIASELAASTINKFVLENISQSDSYEELIRDAIVNANTRVYEKSVEEDSLRGMGTTVTCGIITNNIFYFGHVGDSRGYIVNKNEIRKITEDHSFVQELINNGSITEEEALVHPQRNLITRSVGIDKYVVIDTGTIDISDYDAVIICTDGLTSYVNKEEIKNIILSDEQDAEKTLVHLANERGGKDNISIIIARKEERS